jgi:ribonucleoside-diphosphate reductase alpha chain
MSWVKILDSCITAVNQCGKRKGSLTVALPIWHYDFEDFLHCQTENGDLSRG